MAKRQYCSPREIPTQPFDLGKYRCIQELPRWYHEVCTTPPGVCSVCFRFLDLPCRTCKFKPTHTIIRSSLVTCFIVLVKCGLPKALARYICENFITAYCRLKLTCPIMLRSYEKVYHLHCVNNPRITKLFEFAHGTIRFRKNE